MERVGRQPEGKPYTVKLITGFLTSWKTLLFTLIFMIQPFGSQPFTAFVFWLKAHNKKGQPPVYTVAQIVRSPYSVGLRNLHLTARNRTSTLL
jgi:ACS family pantothenate transporter-like MFS transporter